MSNKTVEQIYEDVHEYLTSIGPCELPSETQIEEFADEFVAAHNREVAELQKSVDRWMEYHETMKCERDAFIDEIKKKDSEIERLNFDNLHLKSVQRQSGEVIIEQTNKVEAKNEKIETLHNMIEKLTDALHPFREWFGNQQLIDRAKEMIGLKEIWGGK